MLPIKKTSLTFMKYENNHCDGNLFMNRMLDDNFRTSVAKSKSILSASVSNIIHIDGY